MNEEAPKISVVIPTYNRGLSIVDTISSILQSDYPDFEIIIIDQSKNNITEDAVKRFLPDPHIQYIHTDTPGAGRARNNGIARAQGSIVAITDDDCIVPTNWLTVIKETFDKHSQVAIILTNVKPAEHDETKGFIPAYVRNDSKLVRTLWEKRSARGLGASLAVRKDIIQNIGGYDSHLGPGSHFMSGDDYDLVNRALLNGWWVYETDETAVEHFGFRTWEEGKALAKRDWIGIGAAYSKPIKCGHWKFLPLLLYEAFYIALLPPLWNLVRLKKPNGIKQIYYFFSGFFRGLSTPVDREKILFKFNDQVT